MVALMVVNVLGAEAQAEQDDRLLFGQSGRSYPHDGLGRPTAFDRCIRVHSPTVQLSVQLPPILRIQSIIRRQRLLSPRRLARHRLHVEARRAPNRIRCEIEQSCVPSRVCRNSTAAHPNLRR